MKILVIGDIVGRPGRKAAKEAILKLKKKHRFDLIIANGENLAHGSGITLTTLKEMREAGVDIFTTGNHIWRHPEVFPEMQKDNTIILRPANYPPSNLGHGQRLLKVKNKKILVINLIGRVFMDKAYDCPFRKMDEILGRFEKEKLDAILVDFHAEATSEKAALKHYLDGRVTALWGTHTHVATADAEVTAKGTAFITDVGMTGPTDSIIGAVKEPVLESFLKQIPFRLDVAEGACIFNAVVIEITGKGLPDSQAGKAKSIKPIRL